MAAATIPITNWRVNRWKKRERRKKHPTWMMEKLKTDSYCESAQRCAHDSVHFQNFTHTSVTKPFLLRQTSVYTAMALAILLFWLSAHTHTHTPKPNGGKAIAIFRFDFLLICMLKVRFFGFAVHIYEVIASIFMIYNILNTPMCNVYAPSKSHAIVHVKINL